MRVVEINDSNSFFLSSAFLDFLHNSESQLRKSDLVGFYCI